MTTIEQAVRSVADVELHYTLRGQGRPILFLHGMAHAPSEPFLEQLAPCGQVLAPLHPGFGPTPPPEWFNGVDDLAYIYLELLERMNWDDVVLVGESLGAWIASEMATKSRSRIARLVLINPIGIKVGDRETRDFPDIYATHPREVDRLMYHDPALAPDIGSLSDADMLELALAREAAVVYLWEPYMHNPQLRRRLHTIDVPTLVLRGAGDGIVSDAYAQAFAAEIPGATFESIAGGGHVLPLEQPVALAARISRFL